MSAADMERQRALFEAWWEIHHADTIRQGKDGSAWELWQAAVAAQYPEHAEPEHDVAVLLRLRQSMVDGTPVHVVITKPSYKALETLKKLNDHDKFLYNEHTCPTNWLGVEYIIDGEDCDPHGIFEHVQTIKIPMNEWGTGLIDFSDPNVYGNIESMHEFFSELKACKAPPLGQSNPTIDKSLVKRMTTQMGCTPPGLDSAQTAINTWWLGKRPCDWDEQRHIDNYSVNCSNDNEYQLARLAAIDAARKEKP